MAAPEGNQFWKLAAYNGRPKIFETPEELWLKACDYFEWCDGNPLESYEWNGKDPVKCELEKMRAYTVKGFCCFANIDEQTLANYGTNDNYKDFFGVVTRIRDVIYCQKFEGAAAGLLNPNIIARDLGLVDRKEVDASVGVKELVIKGERFADKR